MKIRKGFVSNSSSSSFIIGTKELDRNTLKEVLGIPKGGVLDSIKKQIINVFCDAEEKTLEEFLDDYGYTEEEFNEEAQTDEFLGIVKSIFDKGFKLYEGYASDEEGGVEGMICDMEIDYKDEDIIIWKEGGY